MKKITLLILLLCLIQAIANSQGCLPEGIIFTTQAQIDSFQINYPNCTEIEGDVKIGAWLGSDINNLNGLNVVTNIGGGLAIGWWFMGNALLTNLTGLDNLTYIGGDLDIHANLLLQNLTGLGSLTSIGGDIRIGNGDMSSNNGSKMIGNGNPSLKNLAGLENLVSIGGGLYTQFNDSLISFEGLEKLDSLKGIITGDPIASLYELNNLSYIGTDGIAIYHTALSSLTGLEKVTSIAGDLIIDGNDSLVSLAGLENLASIYGNLAIGGYDHQKPGNSSLLSLTGLRNLASVGGNLIIDKNAVLTSLTGLENLTSIEGGNLLIGSDTTYWGGGNPSLISLEGLNNIDANSISGLSILYNTLLNTCEVESICDYLVAPNGTIEISNNATGCNSLQEVEEACAQLVDEISVISDLSIHPNPFTNAITIEYELTKPSTVQLTIYDYLCKKIEVIEKNQAQGKQQIIWNAEGLPAGVYFCVIKSNQVIHTTKLIKL